MYNVVYCSKQGSRWNVIAMMGTIMEGALGACGQGLGAGHGWSPPEPEGNKQGSKNSAEQARQVATEDN